MSKGLVILSHGLESGPHATKVSALAVIAEDLGWDTFRPDYLDLDATRDPRFIQHRLERLLGHARKASGRLVLGGSSMGAFISGLASLEVPVAGLYLVAPPMSVSGFPQPFSAAAVPTAIVHGWQDELIPPEPVIEFARARSARLLLVADGHRLSEQIDAVRTEFETFLRSLA